MLLNLRIRVHSLLAESSFSCEGGYPLDAWEYLQKYGVVSGGGYNSNSGCKPYPFPPCSGNDWRNYPSCKNNTQFTTPTCDKNCQSGFDSTYSSDKYYGLSARTVETPLANSSYGVARDEQSIQKEIYLRGPVEAAFNVYEDFYDYASGVYYV